jgi:hypothetical protein
MKTLQFTRAKSFALVCTAFLMSGVAAQTIKFKPNLSSKRASKELVFQTNSFSGSVSASNLELVLSITNISDSTFTIEDLDIKLLDISKRGMNLCHDEKLLLRPRQKINIILNNCSPSKGLFYLQPSYSSKNHFKESSIFLLDKKWTLLLGTESIVFYTTI